MLSNYSRHNHVKKKAGSQLRPLSTANISRCKGVYKCLLSTFELTVYCIRQICLSLAILVFFRAVQAEPSKAQAKMDTHRLFDMQEASKHAVPLLFGLEAVSRDKTRANKNLGLGEHRLAHQQCWWHRLQARLRTAC